MPAEAIHLTALELSLSRSSGALRAMFASGRLESAARAGALFVDLPYYDRLGRALLMHALQLGGAPSAWGDTFHHRAPIALLEALLRRASELSQQSSGTGEREAGQWLTAFALGYASHVAVDRALHPLVNRLAEERQRHLGKGAFARLHQEVEKVQSIVFHGEYLGRDLLGTPELVVFLAAGTEPLHAPGLVSRELRAACLESLGQSPSRDELARWTQGYRRYSQLLAGPLGHWALRPKQREEGRAWAYDAADFPSALHVAVERCARVLDTLAERVSAGALGDLRSLLPEGTLDPLSAASEPSATAARALTPVPTPPQAAGLQPTPGRAPPSPNATRPAP